MFDLIAKNLSAEQQATSKAFRHYNEQVPIRSSAEQHKKANDLRRALGEQLCTFSNHEWLTLAAMAYFCADFSYTKMGLDKFKEGPVLRIKDFRASFQRDESNWLNNDNLTVDGLVLDGFVSCVVTMLHPQNDGLFDRLFDLARKQVAPLLGERAALVKNAADFSGANFEMCQAEKDQIRSAGSQLLRFCCANPTGFAIC